jgi:5-methylcytosine-specific restriction enzyme A
MSELPLEINTAVDNEELYRKFKCGNAGGMRKSNADNSLTLISDHSKPPYEDWWEENELHFAGQGFSGDQDLQYKQNKTLFESDSNGVTVHLFEKYEVAIKGGKYHYRGRVKLSQEPYQQAQIGQDKNKRNVWIFPLKLIDLPHAPIVTEHDHVRMLEIRRRSTVKLTAEELEERARNAPTNPGTQNTQTTYYRRSEDVAKFARDRANGICELCDEVAPFHNKRDEPFLEVHHIIWLSRGGKDSIANVAALCPNCHRRVHILDGTEDVLRLKQQRHNED